MNLKQSDKMIAVVAVVILIIAAIAIIVYNEPEDEIEDTEGAKLLTYTLDPELKEGSLTLDPTPYEVEHKVLGDGSYTGTIDLPSDMIIESVSFHFDYEDNKMGLLNFFKNMRADTLDITIIDESENEVGTLSLVGIDNGTVDLKLEGPMSINTIEAKDLDEAKMKLEENLTDYMSYIEYDTYTVKVSLTNGESVFRPLVWLSEKLLGKDTFTPTITYKYYDYKAPIPPETEDDDNGDDNGDEDKDTSMTDRLWASTPYMSSNYIGFH